MNGILIAYYSLFGGTRSLAEEIAIQTHGILRELVPDNNYAFDYNTAVKEARSEVARGFCPKLIAGNESIDDFNIIFVGTPNWFSTMAPPVLSFLRKHSFAGKIVIPFCTHGGGGAGKIEKDVAEACKSSVVLPGLAAQGDHWPEAVQAWLERLKREHHLDSVGQ